MSSQRRRRAADTSTKAQRLLASSSSNGSLCVWTLSGLPASDTDVDVVAQAPDAAPEQLAYVTRFYPHAAPKPSSSSSSSSPSSPAVLCVRWNHNNQVLVAGADDGMLTLSHRNGSALGLLPTDAQLGSSSSSSSSSSQFRAVSFRTGSRFLCCGGTGRTVDVWDLKKKSRIKRLRGHTDTVTAVGFGGAKDDVIASSSLSGQVLLHSVVSGDCTATLVPDPKAPEPVRDLTFSPLLKTRFATADDGGSVHVWDVNTRSLLSSFAHAHEAPANSVAFSPTYDFFLASAGLDKRVSFFDVTHTRVIDHLVCPDPLTCIDFESNGNILGVGTTTGIVYLYDLRNRKRPLAKLDGHDGQRITSLRFQCPPKTSSSSSSSSASSAKSSRANAATSAQPSEPPAKPARTNDVISPALTKKPTKKKDSRGKHKDSNEPRHSRRSSHKKDKPEPVAAQPAPSPTPTPPLNDSLLNMSSFQSPIPRRETNARGIVSPGFPAETPVPSADAAAELEDVTPRRTPEPKIRSYEPPAPRASTSPASLRTPASAKRGRSRESRALSPLVEEHEHEPISMDEDTTREDEPRLSTSRTHVRTPSPPRHSRRNSFSPPLPENAATSDYHVQLIRSAIDDSLRSFREGMRQDINNLHLEVLRQFHIQQVEIAGMMEQFAASYADLVEEVRSLRSEYREHF